MSKNVWSVASIFVLVVAGCSSEKSQIKAKAQWLCQHNEIDKPDLDMFPDDAKPSDYIQQVDLDYLQAKKTADAADLKDNPFAAIGTAMQAGLSPVLAAIADAMAAHTTCAIGDTVVSGTTATVALTQTRPDLSDVVDLSTVGDLAKLDSKTERVAKINDLIAKSNKTTTMTASLKFSKTPAGWRAAYDLAAKEAEAKHADLKQKIADLESKKAEADKARAELSKFEVTKARFYRTGSDFLSEAVIDLTVKNGTASAISRAYFKGTLASPGRQVPWAVDDFNYEISGGLEPNETAHWKLDPGFVTKFGEVKPSADAVFTVEVTQLDGPKGETLYSARGFTDDDATSLEKLKGELASVGGH